MAKKAAKSKAKGKGQGSHYRNRNKSTTGLRPMTLKERNAPLAPEVADEWPMPWGLGPNEQGRPPAFRSPKDMWEQAIKYFEWCHANPWYKSEWKDKALQKIPLPRVFTWEGMCIRLRVSVEYFREFQRTLKKDDPMYAEYSWVISKITDTIRTNKFEGASNGQFNANLIAYDLGLRKDQPVGLGAGGTINIQVTDATLSKVIDDVKSQLNKIDDEADTDAAT